MKVLIAGQFDYGQIGGSFQRGFEEMEVEVEVFDLVWEYLSQPLARSRCLNFVFRWQYASAMSARLYRRAKAFRPDLLFITKGHWINPKVLRSIRSMGIKIFNFYTDSPFFYSDRSFGKTNTSRWVYESFELYDVFFTFARYLMADLIRQGCRRVEYLPFARDPELHSPYQGNEDLSPYQSDLCFIGNLDRERIAWLTALDGYPLKVWGEDLRRKVSRSSPLYPRVQRKALYGVEFSKAMKATKISLNLMRQVNARSHNMRTFEAPSCGAFVLSLKNPEVVQLFREDREAAYFSNVEELLEKAGFYLKHPAERNRIAQAGWERVKDETYAKRARRILEIYRQTL